MGELTGSSFDPAAFFEVLISQLPYYVYFRSHSKQLNGCIVVEYAFTVNSSTVLLTVVLDFWISTVPRKIHVFLAKSSCASMSERVNILACWSSSSFRVCLRSSNCGYGMRQSAKVDRRPDLMRLWWPLSVGSKRHANHLSLSGQYRQLNSICCSDVTIGTGGFEPCSEFMRWLYWALYRRIVGSHWEATSNLVVDINLLSPTSLPHLT